MHIFIWFSIVAWFIVIPFLASSLVYPGISTFNGVAFEVLKQPGFWFYVPLACVVALFPVIVTRSLSRFFFPTLADDIMLSGIVKSAETKTRRRNRKDVQRRSGYAFSHQRGFGDFITTGRGFGLPSDQVEAERNKRLSKAAPGDVKVTPNGPPGDASKELAKGKSEPYLQSKNDRDTKEGEVEERTGSHPQPSSAAIPNIPGTPIHGISSQDNVATC